MKKDELMKLIDKAKLIDDLVESARHHANNSREESLLFRDRNIVREQPIIKAVSIDKLKKLVDKLQDEKEYAYANFNEYKINVLNCDDIDDLPDDDYRFGLNIAIELLQLLIAESED
jgi:hypothetical protein